MSSVLRPMTPADHAAGLAWNERDVELLAPLGAEHLEYLVRRADTAAVIVHEGRDVGFVITFGPGADYDSDNYRWFSARHDAFVYLDRIVVDGTVRRAGLGTRVYDELETDAASRAPVFCLEVNLVPPNDPSLAFHHNRGFVEVGQQEANGHVVGLMEKSLGS